MSFSSFFLRIKTKICRKYDNEQNILLSAKNLQKNKPIADHRKQIFIERVMDPFNLPEV